MPRVGRIFEQLARETGPMRSSGQKASPDRYTDEVSPGFDVFGTERLIRSSARRDFNSVVGATSVQSSTTPGDEIWFIPFLTYFDPLAAAGDVHSLFARMFFGGVARLFLITDSRDLSAGAMRSGLPAPIYLPSNSNMQFTSTFAGNLELEFMYFPLPRGEYVNW